jgi:hypothetical protein
MMKKTETKNPLPKLQVRTLDHQALSKVTGGLPPAGGCTGSTYTACHVDGVIDGDYPI